MDNDSVSSTRFSSGLADEVGEVSAEDQDLQNSLAALCLEGSASGYTPAFLSFSPDKPEITATTCPASTSRTYQTQGGVKGPTDQHAPAASSGPLVRVAYLPDPVRGVQNKRGHRKPVPLFFGRFQRENNVEFRHVTIQDVLDDVLVRDGFTLLCILGFGFASSFVSRLGSFGEKKIVAFVKAGGGFVGIGSGAYMGANWGYRLLDIDIVDLHHWKRGTTDDCVLQYTPQGQKLVRASAQEVRVRFANGPLFRVKEPDKVTTVATFQTEMRGKKNNFPAIMKGSPAIVMGRSGRGHVCLMSPHLFEGEPASFAHSRNLFRLCSGSASAIGRDPTVASLQARKTTGVRKAESARLRPRQPSASVPSPSSSTLPSTSTTPTAGAPTSTSTYPQRSRTPRPTTMQFAQTCNRPQLRTARSARRDASCYNSMGAQASEIRRTGAGDSSREDGMSEAVSVVEKRGNSVTEEISDSRRLEKGESFLASTSVHRLGSGSFFRGSMLLARRASWRGCKQEVNIDFECKPIQRLAAPAEVSISRGPGFSLRGKAQQLVERQIGGHSPKHSLTYSRLAGPNPVATDLLQEPQEQGLQPFAREQQDEDTPNNEAVDDGDDDVDDDVDDEREDEVDGEDDDVDDDREDEREDEVDGEDNDVDDDREDELDDELDDADVDGADVDAGQEVCDPDDGHPPHRCTATARPALGVHVHGGCSCQDDHHGGGGVLARIPIFQTLRKGISKLSSSVSAEPVPAASATVPGGPSREVRPDGYTVDALPYVESIAGPIIFTAPHSLKLHRGGAEAGERVRIHLRERWSSEVVVKLARACQEHMGFVGSFVIWNPKTAKRKDPSNMDPNYLTATQQPSSPWHHALHHFRQRYKGGAVMPIMHVDVHGKKDRKTNLDLDVGLGPMEVLWDMQGVKRLKAHIQERMEDVFRGLDKTFRSRATRRKKEMPFTVRIDPAMNGYWGDNTYQTISHQSVLLGTPSLQLEIPYTMRQELVSNDDLMAKFAAVLFSAYKEIYCTGKIGQPLKQASHRRHRCTVDQTRFEEMEKLVPAPLCLGTWQIDNLVQELRQHDKNSTEKVI